MQNRLNHTHESLRARFLTAKLSSAEERKGTSVDEQSELSVGGVTFRFLNGDAIPDENMPFFIRLYALVVPLKTLPDFRLVKIISAF